MEITYLTPDEQGEVTWPSFDNDKKAVVTLGAFDGMHLGHQAVVKRVVELAKKHDAFSVVILFDPRPAFVHGWAAKHDGQEPTEANIDAEALTSVHERLQRIEQFGVDHVLVVRYTLAFASKSYIFFLGRLVGKLGMRTLVLGQDAAMGKDRAGDIKHISNLAAGAGVFELDVVDDRGPGEVRIPRDFKPEMPAEWGEPADPLAGATKAERRAWSKKHQAKAMRAWSSTNVRYLLAHGRIQEANAILGAPHAIEGEVVHGEERGRTIGFPTANLGSDIEGYIPVDGVYAGWLVDLGPKTADCEPSEHTESDEASAKQPMRWPAAISIGTKPTFSEKTGLHERVVESYCITDDWIDLYGHKVRVEFTGFLRPQVKFDGVDELTAELKRNVEETKRLTA
ncbi:bifunctional riboflavin kinase/FMN adenylyltransferase [Bifidobacterium felsineum]|uniref:Bifunctional riboflavin kinase/FMN adenylyltransferase n=1 Tax=Bifidobacterium felsineum TaxID=2045440 RepID=A0A2M9HM62_9BIFI|nr:riboflavin kinase [Bifidobacterium felsineum]MBT1163417.1 bifunctional riboflavin kinase/FMN adenylyltransferase [Bifidobacterium felsineum]PJM77907.1 bifunctional riboflavin kinase/FMN adenylyltransferase [Bifidobacterium felsineum]